jgi:ABC-type multidrug transport system fused ATPase/permease subunit
MPTIRKILALFTPKERRRGYLLLVMILVMGFLDTVGVASIMPFMAVLGNPNVVETNRWLALAYNRLEFADPQEFLLFLGAVVFAALAGSIIFKALTQWALLRFAHMRNHSISCQLLEGYLGRPYIWFLSRHSADLGKSILSEAGQVVNGVVIPAMQLLAQGAVALFLVILLILVDPMLAIMVALVLGGAYLFLYMTTRRFLARIGKDRVAANKERFQTVQEALGGIKEVKIFGREQAFFSRFIKPSFRFARHQVSSQIASQMPRYALELVAFGSILLVALYLFRTHGNFNRILPLLVVYAFAGYRLLPALQQVYQHVSKLRFGLPALHSLYEDMLEVQQSEPVFHGPQPKPIGFQKQIYLEGIYFTYPGAPTPALKGVDLTIPVRWTVGLVGATGSGKTTTVDLILGLLRPDKGRVLVDDTPITADKVRAWQSALGYVPQQIYLADASVAANIAFGVKEEEVDMAAVIWAAKVAELHDFVTNDLAKGYDTLVGERGVRLSGGERQRVGIARALYHDPAVLIFDEATSALDNLTEQAVMSSIHNLGRTRTVIIIAHRLTTVRNCDRIYVIEQGEVVGTGTYAELEMHNRRFQTMVKGVAGGNQ